MIRRALVPLIAVCAALGVGIALGGGPLSNLGHAATTSTEGGAHADPVAAAQARAGQKLAAATATALYGGKLAHQQVAIIALPGAPHQVVTTLAGQVAAAGGAVSSTTTLGASAVDPASKPLIDTLGSQLSGQLHGLVDATQPTYVRFGQLLGAAVGTTGTAPAAPTADQGTTYATLAESKLLAAGAAKGGVQTTAPLVLLVLGAHVDPTILAGIVQGAASRAHGVVVAGSTASGLRGDLKRLRGQDLGKQVATVDGDESTIGQVATILALVHQLSGGGGAYGASGIDGVAPLG
jgi:hypothetical protein